jgi:hypothetical protein
VFIGALVALGGAAATDHEDNEAVRPKINLFNR